MKPRARQQAYGVGIGYRFCIHREIMRCAPLIDFIEVPSEDYVEDDRRLKVDPDLSLLKEAVARFPAIAHGTGLSIGTSAPPDAEYLERLAAFTATMPIAEYSEHLSFIRGIDREVDAFMALPFTDLGVAVAVENVKRARARLGVPFLIENVSYYFALPEATLTEAQFVAKIAEQADCGILLDVANLHINATNHRYDPVEYIDALPPERVLHSHYCGASRGPDAFLYDTHFEVTMPTVWRLLEHALKHTALRALVLERDQRFVPFQEPMDELWRARELFRRHRKARPSPVIVAHQPVAEGAVPRNESAYSLELRKVQETLLRMLLDAEFGRAVEREGETALLHAGIDRDSRRILAAIPVKTRERIGRKIRDYVAKQKAGIEESLP